MADRRFALIVFAAAAAWLAAVAPRTAAAGTYTVDACQAAPDGQNHSWTASNTDPYHLRVRTDCAPSGGGLMFSGGDARASMPRIGAELRWTFTAPAGTTVSAIDYRRWFGKIDDDGWRVELIDADGMVVAGEKVCDRMHPSWWCAVGSRGTAPCDWPWNCNHSAGPQRRVITGLDTSALALRALCVGAPPAIVCGGTSDVYGHIFAASVTLTDASMPSVPFVTGQLAREDVTHAGRETATIDARDNSGIRTVRVYVDGRLASSVALPCDRTRKVPCANAKAASISVDTTELDDGPHEMQFAAVDAAGNERRTEAQRLLVANRPAAPAVPDPTPTPEPPAAQEPVDAATPDGDPAPVTAEPALSSPMRFDPTEIPPPPAPAAAPSTAMSPGRPQTAPPRPAAAPPRPAAEPPARKRPTRLRLTRRNATARRLKLAGRITSRASGVLKVTVRFAGQDRQVLRRATSQLRSGGWSVAVVVPTRMAATSVRLEYAGNGRSAPSSLSVEL